MHTWNRTDKFAIRTDRIGGIEIADMTADRSVYLQPGDSAAEFMFRAERIAACFHHDNQDAAFDRLCDPYTNVMQEIVA